MLDKLIKNSLHLISHFAIFICGIVLTVGISSFIAFGSTPNVLISNFESFMVGRAPGDNVGINMFGTNPYGFFDLNYTDSAAPTGAGYSANVNSNKAGTIVSGNNIGVLGQNKQNAADKYGRVGVVGQVISPTQGVGRGILGFLEPTGPSVAIPGDPNIIPTYVPLASGNLYGLYADAGDSRFANVTVGGTITSTDGTVEFEGPTEFLDELTVNGTVTADRYALNALMYNNNQMTSNNEAANFLQNDLNKMLFTVEESIPVFSSPASGVTNHTVTCPAGSVRVSCYGRVSDSVPGNIVYTGYSSYRGTSLNGNNGCRSYAQNKGQGNLHTAAICMAAEFNY